MVFRTTSTNRIGRNRSAFTLIETLIASGVGLMCLSAFASMFLFSARSFQALFNYEDLHSDDRIATDLLSSDIRTANRVTGYTTNSLTLEDSDGGTVTYTYSPGARTLTRNKNGNLRVLLTECDQMAFRLGQRNPIGGSYDVYPAATPDTAKVLDVSWVCSRTILGVRANSESVQTARIVIRRQGN